MATKFTFLLLPQLHILDLAGADQAIHEAIDFNADFEIEYCGIGDKIFTTSGLPFGDVKLFSEIELRKGDFLIIPGSAYNYLTSSEFLSQKDLFNWIKSQFEKEVNVCSICLGTFVLAETGILNGKNCTTHFKKTKALQEKYPKLKVQENILFTEEDNLYTSAGIVAGVDLTLHIIEKLKGSYFSHLVARELVVYKRRNGNAAQESELLKFRNHIHSGIHKVQDWLNENLEQKANLLDLAEIANMSDRSLTRIFKRETGITVHDYIILLRKEKIQILIKNPDISRQQIAQKCGLTSERQLNRLVSQN